MGVSTVSTVSLESLSPNPTGLLSILPLVLYTLLAVSWLWFSFPTLKGRQRAYFIVSFVTMTYIALAFMKSPYLYLMVLAISATFSFCTYVVDVPRRSASVLLAFLGFLLLLPSEVSHTLWVLWFMSVSLQNYFFYQLKS